MEHSVLNGRVVKRERDETGAASWKYTIIGPDLGGRSKYSAGKVLRDEAGKSYFMITVHFPEERR